MPGDVGSVDPSVGVGGWGRRLLVAGDPRLVLPRHAQGVGGGRGEQAPPLGRVLGDAGVPLLDKGCHVLGLVGGDLLGDGVHAAGLDHADPPAEPRQDAAGDQVRPAGRVVAHDRAGDAGDVDGAQHGRNPWDPRSVEPGADHDREGQAVGRDIVRLGQQRVDEADGDQCSFAATAGERDRPDRVAAVGSRQQGERAAPVRWADGGVDDRSAAAADRG